MFVKIVTIVLVASIGSIAADDVWNGWTARWAKDSSEGFYVLPETMAVAKNAGWTEVSSPDIDSNIIALGYYSDPRVELLFFKETGAVIGAQVSMSVAEIKKAGVPLKYDEESAILKKTLNGEQYYTSSFFFNRNNTRELWIEEKEGLIVIPTKTDELLKETTFLLKHCYASMGIHYNKINSNTKQNTMYPWFLLSADGVNVNGIGYQAIANPSSASQRMWWERQPSSILSVTIPDLPFWMKLQGLIHGVISMHFWFVKDPQDITCIPE